MRPAFLKSLPLVLLVYSYGVFNEAKGYLFGRGSAARESLEVETGDPRVLCNAPLTSRPVARHPCNEGRVPFSGSPPMYC